MKNQIKQVIREQIQMALYWKYQTIAAGRMSKYYTWIEAAKMTGGLLK